MIDYPWLQPILDRLVACEREKKLAHAWLFHGPAGAGKTALVKQLSKQILASGSNEHHKQQWIDAKTHPDFMMIEPNDKGRILIDSCREVIDFLANTPVAGTHKIVCIVQAEKMHLAAQSALLKTVEEPIGHAYLWLTTENTSQLLPTIVSRCQKQAIPLPHPQVLDDWILSKNLAISPNSLHLINMLANGSPGLILYLLSGLSENKNHTLPFLLYLVSIIASNWQMIPGLPVFVQNQLGLSLPDYVFAPKTIQDKQLKIEFYRYVCRLREKVHFFSGMNNKLLLHSIENFDISSSTSKRIVW